MPPLLSESGKFDPKAEASHPNAGAIHAEAQPKHESPADKSVELITSQFPYFDKVTARDALMRIRQHSRRRVTAEGYKLRT